MKFIDFDKDFIVKNSELLETGFYKFKLGNPLLITTIKSKHKNKLISENLSSNVKEDKLMIKYEPTEYIYFSKDLINEEGNEICVSCSIDEKSCSVFVGKPNEFEITTGVLTLSGYISLNNLVEQDKMILSNTKVLDTIKKRVKVLALGIRGDKIFGLYFIPSSRGIALGMKDNHSEGISVATLKKKDCSNYSSFSIKDWFNGTKITER